MQPDSLTVVTLNYYLNTATIIAYHSALVGKTVLLVFILKLKQFLIPSTIFIIFFIFKQGKYYLVPSLFLVSLFQSLHYDVRCFIICDGKLHTTINH